MLKIVPEWWRCLKRCFQKGMGWSTPRKRRQRSGLQQRGERLEPRCVLSVNILQNFAGINVNQGGGSTPPDTILAVGPQSVVQGANDAIRITDKSGTTIAGPQQFPSLFSPNFSAGDFFSDPYVVFDEQANHFYLCILEINSTAAFADLDFAASNSANPTSLNAGSGPGDWTVFRKITAVREGSSTGLPDFPKMGWNADGVFITFNQFDTSTGSFLHTQILSISKASINSHIGQSLPTLNLGNDMFQAVDPNVFTLIPARMHGSTPGGPEFFVTTGGQSPVNTIDVVSATNLLSSTPQFKTASIGVAPFTAASVVPELTDKIDNRMLSADWNNNQLVATHTVSVPGDSLNHVHWYQFDTGAVGTGGTPALKQQGDISNRGHNDMYPGIAINNNGDIGLSFIESASSGTTVSQTPSMFVTSRLAGDPPGTMQPPVLAKAGVLGAPIGGNRGGDYSGTVFDPVNGTFWSANEFTAGSNSTDNWGTQIANYTIPTAAAPVSPPSIARLNQTQVLEGTPGFNLVISGSGFDTTSVVQLTRGGQTTALATTFFNNTQVTAQVPPAMLTEAGDLTVQVTNNSSKLTSGGTTLHVAETAPAGASHSIVGVAGTSLTTIVADFTEPNAAEPLSDYSALIDWGDGKVDAGVVNAAAASGTFTVTGTHTYAVAGATIPVTVTVFDDSQPVLTVGSSATVVGGGGTSQSSVREGASSFLLLVTGAGFNNVSGVRLGGANIPSFFINSNALFAIVPAGLLTEEGSLAVAIAGAGRLSSPTALTVVESIPNASSATLNLQEGQAFTGVVARFSDPNFAKDKTEFSARIDWGDGTVDQGVLSAPSATGDFTVTGSHTYAASGTGIPVTVSISEEGNVVQKVTSAARVADAPLSATGLSLTAPVGGSFTQVVATFSDPDPTASINNYLATITWGDGTSSAGTIVANQAGGFSVVGTHTFATKATFSYSVAIQDAGGASATAQGSVLTGGGIVAIGADAGSDPLVRVLDADGGKWITFEAYESSFRGGVRVATGVLEGVPVVITAPGPGRPPLIKIFNRSTGELAASFLPIPSPTQDIDTTAAEQAFASFQGGMYVALGDLNGDQIPDLVISEGAGGTETVEVFNGNFLTSTLSLVGQPFQSFPAGYTWGATVAAGNGQLLVGNGPGSGPIVGVFAYEGGLFVPHKYFNAFPDPSMSQVLSGVYVALGDFNGDGVPDIITGTGDGNRPTVNVFDGTHLFPDVLTQPVLLSTFDAYPSYFTSGVRVAAVTLPGLSRTAIWTVPGPNNPLRYVGQFVYVSADAQPSSKYLLYLDPAFAGGAFIA